MTDVDWNFQLAEQLDWHWREQLRPRLSGLTDEEYRWEPVPGAWNVRPRGTGTAPVAAGAGAMNHDLAVPAPRPPPGAHRPRGPRPPARGIPRLPGGPPLRRAPLDHPTPP